VSPLVAVVVSPLVAVVELPPVSSPSAFLCEGFFHDATPFHSRTRGVTLHLVRFFLSFSFSFSFADCSPFSHMYPTCSSLCHALCRPLSPLLRRPPSLCHVPRRPSSPLLQSPPVPLSLSLSLPLRLDATSSLPSLWDMALSHLVLGRDTTLPRLVLGYAVPHSTLLPFPFFFLVRF
jgi:hypothetical protein